MYVTLHDPYISALSEIEDTDIFDGLDEDDYNDYDSLFDEDAPEVKIEILILKETTIGGKKIAKDTIVEIEEKEAKKVTRAPTTCKTRYSLLKYSKFSFAARPPSGARGASGPRSGTPFRTDPPVGLEGSLPTRVPRRVRQSSGLPPLSLVP